MATDADSTDDAVELPANFAEHAATVSGLDAPPATLEEWWTAVFEQFSESSQRVTLADLYRDEPTRHEVHANDRIRYAGCVADALTAAVLEPQETITVRSIDPVAATPVTFTIGGDSVAVSPAEGLICFGSTVDVADVRAIGSFANWVMQDDTSAVEAAICQHTNAFESEATYERWATETESVTAPLPPGRVVRLMRALIQTRD